MPKPIIRMYLDGAYSQEDDVGACAFIAMSANYDVVYEWGKTYRRTTSNRMELWAAIHALDWCINKRPKLRPVLYTDSRYLNNMQHWIPHWQSTGWRTRGGRTVQNIDLVLTLWLKWTQSRLYVSSHWVKGHNGNLGNEMADELAESLIREYRNPSDDMWGIALLTIDDLADICKPEHLDGTKSYCRLEEMIKT